MKTKITITMLFLVAFTLFIQCKDDNTVEPNDVLVEQVSLSKTNISLSVGESYLLTVTVEPTDAANKAISWSIEGASPAGCVVVSNGTVRAIEEGVATVVATADDGSKCSDKCEVTVAAEGSKVVDVESVILNKQILSLRTGEEETLVATILPENATDKTVTWSSTAPDVASVKAGVIKALKAGDATIKVTTNDGGKSAQCKVNIIDASAPEVAVTDIAVAPTSKELSVGESALLTVTLTPEDATNKNVEWSSSAPEVATVMGGSVKALSAGSTTITVTSDDGNLSAEATITVIESTDPNVKVSAVTLSARSLSLMVNENSRLGASVLPINATNKDVIWSSSDELVAVVDQSGMVFAVREGETTIVATSADNGTITDVCALSVSAPIYVTAVALTQSEITLPIDEQYNLEATIYPYNASNQEVEWQSTQPSIASVTDRGYVRALATGVTDIIVTTEDGFFRDTCSVTVIFDNISVRDVKLSRSNLTLEQGRSYRLYETITPVNATNQTVSWSSSDTNVVLVSGQGQVTAIYPGRATVYVTTADGSKRASCEVLVEYDNSEDLDPGDGFGN